MVKSDAEWVDLSNKQLEIEATVVKKKLSGVTNGPDIHAPLEPIPDNDWTGETWGLFWPDQEMEEKSEDPTKYIKKHYEDKSCKEWSVKLDELAGMWTKQTEMLNKVTSTMVEGDGAAGEQVNLNELDAQMEQIKDMFVKKQEMMKKMSSVNPPNPAELAA